MSICKRNCLREGEDELSVLCGHGISLECMLFYLRNYVGVQNSTEKVGDFPLWRGRGM